MITFLVSTAMRPSSKYPLPQVLLSPDEWNDWWEFKTLFGVTLFDEDGYSHSLGGVKIGQLEMSGKRPDLPEVFTKLSEDFFSLGQDSDYYEDVKNLGDNIRESFLNGLNDIAFDEEQFKAILNERVTRNSLMRDVTLTSVSGRFRRLAHGDATLTPYEFSYTSYTGRKNIPPIIMDFSVQPSSNPPSNIHVIIGRNGVGKTRLINNMIHSIIEENSFKFGKFALVSGEESSIFSNLVSVTFSAFDTTEPIPDRKKKGDELTYSYIGLRTESAKGDGTFVTKSLTKLKNEFVRSAHKCIIGGKKRSLKAAIRALEADAIFSDADLTNVLDLEQKIEFESVAGGIFNKLSSGHMIVLLTVTRLVETIEEKSLVLIDEPETHLHPPLLSAFVRALSDLLTSKNAVAIVATHSPVVLQEVPRTCCWKLDRSGYYETVARPESESFGENVGALTQEVFGLEVTHSGFHQILRQIVTNSDTYNEAIQSFDNQLGFEAKAILRVLINKKQQGEV